MSTFVDTSALYAVLDRDDKNHGKAAYEWTNLVGGPDLLTTSTYVVVETTALVQHRLGMKAVRSLYDDILPAINLVVPSADLHQRSVAALLLADRRSLSLVDCASFEVMREHGLAAAFAFDPHFPEHGFQLVGSDSL